MSFKNIGIIILMYQKDKEGNEKMKTVYYSEILKKYFDSEEECKAAEKKIRDEKRKEAQARKLREEEYKKVEQAIDNVTKAHEEAQKMIEAAEKECDRVYEEFISKYGIEGFEGILMGVKEKEDNEKEKNLKERIVNSNYDGDRKLKQNEKMKDPNEARSHKEEEKALEDFFENIIASILFEIEEEEKKKK